MDFKAELERRRALRRGEVITSKAPPVEKSAMPIEIQQDMDEVFGKLKTLLVYVVVGAIAGFGVVGYSVYDSWSKFIASPEYDSYAKRKYGYVPGDVPVVKKTKLVDKYPVATWGDNGNWVDAKTGEEIQW